MNRYFRRWMSSFLVAVLIASSISTDAFAASGKAAENISLPEASVQVKALSASRLEDLTGTEAVYFGTASADLQEGDGLYSIPVYREGDLETEASVSLVTLDISASYGADYELVGEDIFVAGADQTILQKSNGNGQLISEEQVTEETAEEKEDAGSDADADEGAGSDADADEGEEYEQEAGAFSRALLQGFADTQTGGSELSDEEVASMLKAENIDFSAGMILDFAPGESEKTVVFRVMEDELEEGQEMFQFMLTDAEGTTVKTQYSFAAVINDNEELHDAQISFSQESYTDLYGKVTVTVTRSSSAYSMIDFYLVSAGDTAQEGENYTGFYELVTMQPYQTSLNYTFEVSGQGRMEVLLVPETACVVSGIDTAEVLIDVKETEEELSAIRQQEEAVDLLSETEGSQEEPVWQAAEEPTDEEKEAVGLENGQHCFNITMDGFTYTVKYEGEGKNVIKGGIYDTKTYQPVPVRVGDYYFSTDNFCYYGKKEGAPSDYHSHYVQKNEAHNSYGYIYWYSWWTRDQGSAWFDTKMVIPTTHYRYAVPDWQGLSGRYGYQTYEFKAWDNRNLHLETKLAYGYWDSNDAIFDRRIDTNVRLWFPNGWENKKVLLQPVVADRGSNSTPKTGLNVYGFALFYKAYSVRVRAYDTKKYKTAAGEISALPFHFELKSGIQSAVVYDQYCTVYTDSEEKDSTLTFSTKSTSIGGESGIYGKVKGYEILYNADKPEKQQRTLKYPEDFFKWMDNCTPEVNPEHNYVDYRAEAVKNRKNKAADLQTLNFDRYMIDWLQSYAQEIYGRDANFGGSSVKLAIRPVIDYIDVKVHVMEPAGGKGNFTDPKLSKVGDYTFHAGDTLNLKAEAKESGKEVTGYRVSYDKVNFATVPANELFLYSNENRREVWIYPEITEINNRIEVKFKDNAQDVLSVANLTTVKDVSTQKDRYYLLIDKSKKEVRDQIKPTAGELYQLLVTVTKKPAEAGYVYRPYFEDRLLGKTVTQMYPIIARGDWENNVITIGVEKVLESSLKEVSISGTVVSRPIRIRETGFDSKYRPAVGYSLTAFAAQVTGKDGKAEIRTQTAVANDKGVYTLTGIRAKAGDEIPVLVTGGFGSEQVAKVKVGNGSSMAEPIKVTYPYNAPEVTSVSFLYDKPENNRKTDLSGTTVQIYDDALNLQFVVKEGKRTAARVIVTVQPYKGDTFEVEAVRKLSGGQPTDVWEAKIPNMVKKLHNGDRFYVRVIDAQKMEIKVGGQTKMTDIVYPEMDTGLVCALQITPKVPQWYEAGLLPGDDAIDIPFLGKGSRKQTTTTGLLSFERVNREDGKGYSLVINVSAGMSKLEWTAKAKKINEWRYRHKEAAIKKESAELETLKTLTEKEASWEKISNLQHQLYLSKQARAKAMEEDAANPQGKMSEWNWQTGANTLVLLDFVKVGNEYRYVAGSMVLGFSLTVDYTKLVMIKFIPGYFNVGGCIQADYSGMWLTETGKKGLPEDTLEHAEGNLKELLELGGKSYGTGEFVFGVKAFGGVGVGAKGIVGAKGAVDVTFQVGVPTPKTDPTTGVKKNNGWSVDFGGGITINALVMDITVDVLRAKFGFGAWKGKTEGFQWFGFVKETKPGNSGEGAVYTAAEMEALRNSKTLSTDENEETRLVEKLAGTEDMSVFGTYGSTENDAEENGQYAVPEKLLANAADDPEIQAVQTAEDGSLFMVFIGSRGDKDGGSTENGNAQAVYYVSYKASEDKWTKPELLDPDGTFDTAPSVNLNDDVISVTWSSAQRAFEETDSELEKLSLLRIKTASFDVLPDGSVTRKNGTEVLLGTKASPSDAAKTEEAEEAAAEAAEENAEAAAFEKEEIEESLPEDEGIFAASSGSTAYYDVYGESWVEGGNIYTVFLRYDLSEVNAIEEILDYRKVKPEAWLAEVDLSTGEISSLQNLGLTAGDSLLMDMSAGFLTVEGKGDSKDRSFITLVYTQDTDGEFETTDDNDLKLCLVETAEDTGKAFVYPAMDIPEENGISEFSTQLSYAAKEAEDADLSISLYGAQITQAAGSTWLTYLKNGWLFETVDLGRYIGSMFGEDYLAGLFRSKAKSIGGGTKASAGSGQKKWYQTTVEELNTAYQKAVQGTEDLWYGNYEELPEAEAKKVAEGESPLQIFEDSPLAAVGTGAFETTETCLSGSFEEKLGIGEYRIVSSGEDLYIVYTDYPATRIQPEKELYCVKLNRTGTEGEKSSSEKENYFSAPVQLTDEGHVISEFAAFMRDGKLTVISDTYDQIIPEEGGILYSPNSIVMTEYLPRSILKINEADSGTSFAFSGEEEGTNYIYVSYSVINEGLEPQAGYRTWVLNGGEKIFEAEMLTASAEIQTGGEITESKQETRFLRSGETDSWTFPWAVTGSGENEQLTVVVADAEGNPLDSVRLTVDRQQRMDVEAASAEYTEDGHVAKISVKNTGNADTEASVLKLNLLGEDDAVQKTYQTVEVPALRAGESRELTVRFAPSEGDYTENGIIMLEAALPGKDGSGFPFNYVAGEPEQALINGGAEVITLRTGRTTQLLTQAAPLSEETGEVYYSTGDPSVVSVSEDGKLTALKDGSATITAYLPSWGLFDDITVIVSSTGSEEDDSENGTSYYESLPSYVDRDGTWKQDEKGNWVYTTRAGAKVKNKWLAIARSTFGGGKGFEWFRFDQDGNMVTGWFRDSDDRMYYLQTVSDGNKGRMLTGRQLIDGKWYYFNTVSDGYKGALLPKAPAASGE